jgi:Family of unknown function (DUF6502)
MSHDSRKRPKKTAERHPTVMRIDGARNWPKTLDHFVWFLLRAGVKPEHITKTLATSVSRHRYTQALVVPRPQVLEYSRVITEWMTDPLYLDDYGNTVTLPVTGARMSFRSLVRKALPHEDAGDVLKVLSRHGIVRRIPSRRVQLLADTFLPNGQEQAQFLAYTLSALEGIIDTCHANLTTRDSKKQLGQVQRLVIAERFDMSRIAEYDAYARKSAHAMLAKHDAWLKRREVGGPVRGKGRVGYVGVGIFGFKAR